MIICMNVLKSNVGLYCVRLYFDIVFLYSNQAYDLFLQKKTNIFIITSIMLQKIMKNQV